ncbi:MAG: polyphosphate polymerase domain-containing protein [Phaeodactylibacter sp.]|nr:polyphosphate polymerase domain-containing protein [Phaeodactylibacter sp.]MCB9274731.1 polyphosphate polymerase domain-containing protein [Lewinellaceae bacterium]
MRYERKFRLEDISQQAAGLLVRMHPAGFRQHYPARWVNNLYFDSPAYDAFQDNASGAPQRAKYRLRWYGRPFEHLQLPVLEVKWKEGEAGSKKAFPLENGPFALSQLDELAGHCRHILGLGKALQPVLFNSYYRSYWIAADARFRLTIDSSMCFGPCRATSSALLPYTLPGTVIEVKYPVNADADSDLIFQNFPFRRTKSSKYASGLGLVYG